MLADILMVALYSLITVITLIGGGYAFGCWLCGGVRNFNRVIQSVYGTEG